MSSPDEVARLLRVLAERPWLGELFPRQFDVADAPERFRAVTTSRRGGKTVLLAALAADALHACQHDEVVVYLARTRQIAKDVIWQKLKRLAEAHRLPWTFREQELRIDTPVGGALLVRGAEGGAPGEELDKLRGLKMRRVLVDEPATYAETLGALLRDVVEPGLGDLRGDVIITGTPGIVCAGTWYEISTGLRPKWRTFGWTIRDNPHFPEAEKYLAEARAENAWDEDNPTYQREYLGQWVVDDAAQVYRYLASRNDTDMPRNYSADTWIHGIALDFGISDDFAWCVLGAHPHERTVYVLEAGKRAGLLVDEMAEHVSRLVARFSPQRLSGDPGGGGKALIEQWNRRHAPAVGISMQAAQKTEKRAHIDLINTELRTGRLLVVRDSCKPLTSEIQVLPWADERREKEHPAYANHCADAMLYAWRDMTAFWHAAPKLPPPPLAPDDPTRIAQEWEAIQRKRERPWWDDQD